MNAKILAVEDSPTQASALEFQLRRGGHSVLLSSDGEDALQRLEEEEFDLVISDVVMPGSVDGYDLCRSIKARMPEVPVILLTSLSDALDIIHGLEAGADNFLTKPYQPDQLLDRIDILLTNRRLRATERLRTGVRVFFRGHDYVINSEKEQILDLLVSTFEEAVDQNRKLVAREEELSRAREELARYARSLEAQLSAILGSVPDALFSVDPSWHSLHYVSPGAFDVFGCEADEFSISYWRDHIDPHDRDRVEACRHEVATKGVKRTFEYRFRNGQPEPRRILETVVPVEGEHGVARVHGIARDVTEQWKAQQKLELSDTILRHVGNLVVVADETGAIRYVSPSAQELTGYEPAELLDNGWWELLRPKDGEATKEAMVSLARGEDAPSRDPYETELRHKDGRLRTFLWTDARGPGGLVVGVGSDITERRVAQERMERVAASDIVGIFYWDLQGGIVEANDEFLRIVGYEREDLESGLMNWAAMTPPEFKKQDNQALAEIMATGKCTPIRKEFYRKDGGRAPIIIGAALFEHTPDEGVAFAVDIADLKSTESALRRQTRNLRLLQSVTESANRSASFDEAMEEVLHKVCEGIDWPVGHAYVARGDGDAARLVPSTVWHLDDAGRFEGFRGRSMSASFRPGEGLLGRVWTTGTPMWVADLSTFPDFVRGPVDASVASGFSVPVTVGTDTVAVLEFFHDEPQAEDPEILSLVLQIGTQLGRVAEREQARRRQEEVEAQARQSQKLEAVGRLAGGVAHDFNNLLTVIVTEAALVKGDYGSDEEVQRGLQQILDAAGMAKGLTSQLLTFSRGGTSRPELIDVSDVVRGMESMLHRLVRQDVLVRSELAASLPLVLVDRGQLEQVLMNLVVNARDAMPDGGEVRLATGRSHISSSSLEERAKGLEPGEYVVLTVTDRGTGMPADVQEHIFEPFYTTKEPGKGTGLGLATCYGIVTKAGGRITVDSQLGTGTTFTVWLPAAEGEGLPQDEPDASTIPRGAGEAVLVVEDEAGIRTAARRILERLGYHVQVAANGDEALELVAEMERAPDLLFTDVMLPGIDGGELAERLRGRWPGLRVLYTSGHTDDVVLAKAGRGEVCLVQKPYTFEELARGVHQALEEG